MLYSGQKSGQIAKGVGIAYATVFNIHEQKKDPLRTMFLRGHKRINQQPTEFGKELSLYYELSI